MKGEQLRFFNVHESKRNKFHLNLSLDTAAIFVIIIIFICIFSYVLGVKKGEKIGRDSDRLTGEFAQSLIVNKARDEVITQEKAKKSLLKDASPEKASVETRDKAPVSSLKKYVIQVATYKTRSASERARKILEKEGYPTIISKKGKYLVIFVGEYSSRKEAESHLKDLRKEYNDCFIRRL